MARIRRYAIEHLPQLFQLIATSNQTALAVMLQNVSWLLSCQLIGCLPAIAHNVCL